jgi:hypothetical protein
MRVAMLSADEAVQFGVSQNHRERSMSEQEGAVM